jgi:hypothetical protein|nr:hypothetical protein [Actinomycetales bacterium]
MTLLGHVAARYSDVTSWLGVGCRRKDGAVGHDDLDSRVHDRVALDEIALYAEVLAAVNVAGDRLTLEELDNALGLRTSAKH